GRPVSAEGGDRLLRTEPELAQGDQGRLLGVALGGPRADVADTWVSRLERALEVPRKVRKLVRDGREDPVIVEARLADRHDPRVLRPLDDRLPARLRALRG